MLNAASIYQVTVISMLETVMAVVPLDKLAVHFHDNFIFLTMWFLKSKVRSSAMFFKLKLSIGSLVLQLFIAIDTDGKMG